MQNELIIAYFAMVISVSGRFIFMYLLYTKKSTNIYSLIFSIMNMVSSSLWITYSQIITDLPLLIRGSSDLILFTISTAYIMTNRLNINKLQPEYHITMNCVKIPERETSVGVREMSGETTDEFRIMNNV